MLVIVSRYILFLYQYIDNLLYWISVSQIELQPSNLVELCSQDLSRQLFDAERRASVAVDASQVTFLALETSSSVKIPWSRSLPVASFFTCFHVFSRFWTLSCAKYCVFIFIELLSELLRFFGEVVRIKMRSEGHRETWNTGAMTLVLSCYRKIVFQFQQLSVQMVAVFRGFLKVCSGWASWAVRPRLRKWQDDRRRRSELSADLEVPPASNIPQSSRSVAYRPSWRNAFPHPCSYSRESRNVSNSVFQAGPNARATSAASEPFTATRSRWESVSAKHSRCLGIPGDCWCFTHIVWWCMMCNAKFVLINPPLEGFQSPPNKKPQPKKPSHPKSAGN